jgi:RNA polymerase sigma-70 factor (ECF subfamily)
VVRNTAISTGRSDRRRKGREQRWHRTQNDWFVYDPSQKLDADKAVAVLQQLDVHVREIIISHLWGGLTFEEIAQVVGTSSSTCHRIYVRGLEQIRLSLGEIHVP